MNYYRNRIFIILLLFSIILLPGCSAYVANEVPIVAAAINLSASKRLTVKELSKENTINDKILATVYDVNLPNASYKKLPEWKGFNLLEKFSTNNSFTEEEFSAISELGYNYVRLPMSYLTWIKNGNWNSFNESTLKNIDKAIEYGIKYNIHIDLNFHRAPGYCVNPPIEKYDLWTSAKAQRAFVAHWSMFAKRYAGIPNTVISFNLINEPSNVDDATYTKVMAKAIEAIRKVDPNRLIIVDGIDYASAPSNGLVKYKVAQSFHSYDPMALTHYKASWISGSNNYPEPQWPIVSGVSTYLYGSGKPEYNNPLIISGTLPEGKLGIHVTQVSSNAHLIVEADNNIVLDKKIQCTDGEGDWYEVVYAKEWNIYQNYFNIEYLCDIPVGTQKLSIYLSEGDWLTYSQIKLYNLDRSVFSKISASQMEWGSASKEITVSADGKYLTAGSADTGKDWLIYNYLQKWVDFSKKNKIGIMVGEWGVHNQTPHNVTIALITDKLKAFKELNLGWALWNFNGSFGIVDSNRNDVRYKNFKGYKIDEKMSELLSKYID